ncbi:MAG: 3',5'-cyclic-AMP phosphodiesterase [Zetaproteobacteria bacterium CG_4_9_14_3_um_filter_49_83]|nr:MAG: hypothetical protein AUJ56_10835 [Zetaproteobacteria bacterium CG1_02_49_23]PIQ29957.1 MAG: 3',5'-cyclic-AMP phosphodiesterase [Zetaproteobacteria bacterium CG17_big_fil_post_rev_8_21_14_2_50_50_13]PIV31454.1 MAG: 3',5'-cyclic-AMP phosphodiesterase [Zetaproteobacteria bacterium CG02_land_8_20_14_3_00_50_9]PIY55024.1 MAG: 3',5'-cyclic-AMP phosphodiesterase [Zetaproteobacteria bacterium CG_4_10_14_0_8_um_filter_49_80]PJA36524.1 MAG: 3',5'-cyclic-AMP phosphodiesterase [Zetaproteobacteria b
MKVLHITDSHLYADADVRLKNVNTDQSFQQVINTAVAAHPDVALTVLGGDMAQDCLNETYFRLQQHFKNWPSPFLLSPGNHALIENIELSLLETLIQPEHWQQGFQSKHWHIISLNSNAPGQISGHLSDEELCRLQRLLETSQSTYIMIALHHHPLPIDSAWLDQISLQNADAFWSLLQSNEKVRAVIHGHTHQSVDHWHKHIRVLGAPSTCIQFKPNQQDFTLDDKPPGYRWLELADDGSISTGVERIEGHIPDLTDLTFY